MNASTENFNSAPTSVSTATLRAHCKTYKRRFWMLFLFSAAILLNGALFPLYVAMADVNGFFYGVSQNAVNWTTMAFMVVYLVLAMPMAKMAERMNLWWIVVLGALFNTAACAMQFAGLRPDAFSYVMVSVVLASVANILLISTPPFLATRWFPGDQVSRACAVGVVGNQIGLAVGYIIPPLVIPSDFSHKSSIEEGKRHLAIYYTAASVMVTLLVVCTFQNGPPTPASQAEELKNETSFPFLEVLLRMLRNKQFLLVLLMDGLMCSTALALATSLNDLVQRYFQNKSVEIGWMGFLLCISGLMGSILAGYILDRTHRFKETSLVLIILSLVSLLIFGCVLTVNLLWIQFLTISALGFFLVSFLPVGFEYGVEVTYPDSEYMSACLLNISMNLFGVALTQVASRLLGSVGPIAFTASLAVTLILCAVVTCFITTDYKRSKMNSENSC